jgi:hypothetical protein
MIRSIVGVIAAVSVATLPVAAAAAPNNPAQSLSIAKSVRAGTPTARDNKLFGGGAIFAAFIIAAIAAIVVIGETRSDKPKSP